MLILRFLYVMLLIERMDLDDVNCDIMFDSIILRRSLATEFIVMFLFFLAAPVWCFNKNPTGETLDPGREEAGGDTIDPDEVILELKE